MENDQTTYHHESTGVPPMRPDHRSLTQLMRDHSPKWIRCTKH
jgi:hypothetical protein